ncbi:MAG: YebC/PmpR family DNA-binding transcriptional regulator [Clostridia bacterium]
MSGHSKWHNIQRAKEKTDAQKGKIFTKIGRELAVSVKAGGSDPATNSRLFDAIAKAKQSNMPADGITRAIKKASGELFNINYEETMYEGYGIGGSAVMVKCLTDNKNRTAGDIRHLFDKYGGGLGATNCVSYLFKHKGIIFVEKTLGMNVDDFMMLALEYNAVDVNEEDEVLVVETESSKLQSTIKGLSNCNILESKLDYLPDVYITLDDDKKATFEKMLEKLEELDDVQDVFHNVILNE